MEPESGFEQNKDMGIAREFLTFLMENKLWWMMPIAFILLLLLGIIALGTAAGGMSPFIYTLF